MANDFKKILKNVLDKIDVNTLELNKRSKIVLSLLNEKIKKLKIPANAVLAGSLAKGTIIKKDSMDIDIYVIFDKNIKDISKELKKLLKESKFDGVFPDSKLNEMNGSRDYFQLKVGDVYFEIVPIYKIKKGEHSENPIDYSPYHLDYVLKNKTYSNDIKLAKQFFIANNIYGAESYRRGFSGYIIEVMTIHYKGFLNMTKAISKWNEKIEIGEKEDIALLKDVKKTRLVVIDPTMPSRNLGTVVSNENIEKIIGLCKNFIKSPSDSYFEQKNFEDIINTAMVGRQNCIAIKILMDGVDDDSNKIGAKERLFVEDIVRLLKEKEFKVYDMDFVFNRDNNKMNAFIISDRIINKDKIVLGPPLNLTKNVQDFKKKYKNTYTDKGRLCTKITRKYYNLDFLKDEIKKMYKRYKEYILDYKLK